MSVSIQQLEVQLEQCKASGQEYVYAETGRYKPFHPATIKAARDRGYKVEKVHQNGVYYIYPKVAS